MPHVDLPENVNLDGPYSGPTVQKPINPAISTWHAAFAGGGGAIDVAAGFTDPGIIYADRVPEVLASAAAVVAAPCIIDGTYDGAVQTDTLALIAGATVKATKPFDTVTRFRAGDPGGGQTLTLNQGDTWATPPCRCMWTGDGGDILCRLMGEVNMGAIVITLPLLGEWVRRIERIDVGNTTVTGAWLCW